MLNILPQHDTNIVLRKGWRGFLGVGLVMFAVLGALPLAFFFIHLTTISNPQSQHEEYIAEFVCALALAALVLCIGYRVGFQGTKENGKKTESETHEPPVLW